MKKINITKHQFIHILINGDNVSFSSIFWYFLDEEDDEHWESVDFQDRGAFDIFDNFNNENQI